MITDDNNNHVDVPDVCVNCGKGEESSGSLKSCTACQMVRYCNRDCQIAHRPQHKKECRKRAAELHDEKLFKQPPPKEDCPICMLRLPTLITTGSAYMNCCGKVICSGCACAPVYDDKGNEIDDETCPFCRTPVPTCDEEVLKRIQKRVEAGDGIAIYNYGNYYHYGENGCGQDYNKALELFHRAAELGVAEAYHNIGHAYEIGIGVKQSGKKANHYYELSAMGGCMMSRHNLGVDEAMAGNMDRAFKHYLIAVRGGVKESLDYIQNLYTDGHATKEDYTKALRAYQVYLDEIRSDQRDKAAAATEDNNKYI